MKRIYFFLLLLFPILVFGQSPSIVLTPLPDVINTKQHEELGRWTIDGSSLLFTRIAGQKVNLVIAKYNLDGTFKSVENFPFDSTYYGGGHAISPDGRFIVFTLCGQKYGRGGCDLYMSELRSGIWSAPVNLGTEVNSTNWDYQPAFGLDGLTIYFASNRPGGFGGSDIWYTREVSPSHWSKPINAGAGVNTADNEASPFIHFDGRTMYFMRDGAQGQGGYDLYLSHLRIDGLWDTAINLGRPINTEANEGGLALHPDGKIALITRSTPNNGNDLYTFQLPKQLQSIPVQALKVNIVDEGTNKPVRAQLELFEINGNDTIRKSQIADESGNITTTLDRNKPYGCIASAPGYILYSSNLPADPGAERKLFLKMTPLASAVNKAITLQNIFFESGSHDLLSSSMPELNLLVETLQNNPAMKIEIRGHTDAVGDANSNQLLSEARAESVYNYLLSKGIEVSRLSHKGFGETKPVASNNDEAGRKQNRRTEFVILKL